MVLPDGIYAIGGFDGSKYIGTVEKYDIETDTWNFVSPLSSAKCTMSVVPQPDFRGFLVIGGFNKQ